MKTLLVVRPHSFVDVITNSSSELFVCNTDKPVALITEFLEDLLKVYNKFHKGTPEIFEDCFKKVDVIKNEKQAKEVFLEDIFCWTDLYDGEDFKELSWEEKRSLVLKKIRNKEIDISEYVKPGDIIIRSASDNTIPYESWEFIIRSLNATRYHQG